MLLWLLLPAILYLGIVSSYTDIKLGKIRNRDILFSSIYALFVISAYILYQYFQNKIDYLAAMYIVVNLITALFFGFLLWIAGFWTAGDAKLYTVFALIVSAAFPKPSSLIDFPFVSLTIYSFVPFFLFFAISSLFYIKKEDIIHALKESVSIQPIILAALSIFVLLWPLTIFPKDFSDPIFSFALVFVLYVLLEKITGKWIIYVLLIFSAARLFFDKRIYSLNFLYVFIIFLVVFVLLRRVVFVIGSYAFSHETKISELKPGMIPTETLKKIDKKYQKEPKKAAGFFSEEAKDAAGIFQHRPEGLYLTEISKLKKLSIEKKLDFSALRINDTLPFSPFMFLAVIIIVILSFL
jgi:Flp pilus assembly protein protease CpaA